MAAPAVAAAQTVVGFAGVSFAPDRVAIKTGESVTWRYPDASNRHNVRFEDGNFTQPKQPDIDFAVQRAFPRDGTYRYYCENHGSPGGIGMSGIVYVNANADLPPRARFAVRTNPTVAGRPVHFDAAATTASATIAKYEWDLNGNGMYGDAEDKEGAVVSQTYLLAQEIDVRLRVTDVRGGTDVFTRLLMIEAPPRDPVPVPDPSPSPAPAPPLPAPASTAPAPSPTAPAPPAPTPRRAGFSFSAAATVKRARGAAVAVTCAGRCRFTATLSVSASVARKARLGRKAVTIGAARGTLGVAGTKRVTVKLTSKARKRTAKLRSLRATLKLTVIDASGTTSRKQKRVTLER